MKKVGICICTYKRDTLLLKLIDSLINQTTNINISFDIIIVDNYGKSDIGNILKNIDTNINIIYQVESQRGISYARNRCIDVALDNNYDYIIFIDDDEVASSDWLYNMITTVQKFNSSVVKGPAITIYNDNTSKWIKNTKFFDEKLSSTGTELHHCATNNTLISTSILRKHKYKFDPRYNLSGGEDTMFFKKMVIDGHKIVFCSEAKVYENLHKERQNMKYMLKRVYVNSISYIKIEKELAYSKKDIFLRIVKAIVHILTGIVFFPVLIFKGKTGVFYSLSYLIKGIGQLSGFFNKNVKLY
ncbi:glycosyltransferase family 2 protein [Gottfriedia acidiceleris]|uniref:glycosyltransferase family 2 protein n=1 Tax=Gottfriedia acidiceleris TaxID=371036 RepID=UPI000B44F883|nr:glycosyltransferase family 2 protein [Gottfriedia acidiceleris]